MAIIGDCMADSSNAKLKISYFSSFAGYNIPLKPIERIDKKEALSRRAYCVGYFNNKNQLIKFEKYIDGKLFFRHEYSYFPNGKIKENRGIDADGNDRLDIYNKKGKRISTHP